MAPKSKPSPETQMRKLRRAALRDVRKEVVRALKIGVEPEDILGLVREEMGQENEPMRVETEGNEDDSDRL